MVVRGYHLQYWLVYCRIIIVSLIVSVTRIEIAIPLVPENGQKEVNTMADASVAKIRIKLKAYDSRVIDAAAKQIVETALRSGASVVGPVPLPVKRSTFTVVKSPHVYKTGGEAFEMRVHKRLIDIVDAKPKTIDSLQNLSLPAGVDAEIRM